MRRPDRPKSSVDGLRFTLSIKIAQKPYIIGSLGPKALKYESFEGKGWGRYKTKSVLGFRGFSKRCL